MGPCPPFRFFTERRLVLLTGIKARTLPELAKGLKQVPGACVFYHTHHRFLSQHFQKPWVYNDFAIWVMEALQMKELAEKLAAMDLREFTTIRDLRQCLLGHIGYFLKGDPESLRSCPPGDEFHFCRSQSFIMATGVTAETPREFFHKMADVSVISIYFHFIEARLRLGHRTNDFSQWLSSCGEPGLAEEIAALDPYLLSLEELKSRILSMGERKGGC